MPFQPECVCVGAIIIDDVVLPDGTTHMATPGGGAAHAAAGVAVWNQRPGLVSAVGTGLPGSVRERLARDFDLQGVVTLDKPQPRAWQLFEWDGRRTELFRVAEVAPFLTRPAAEHIPASYEAVRGLYLLRGAEPVAAWRARFPQAALLWEPLQPFMVAANAAAFRAALPLVDVVSPNLLEAGLVYGFDDPLRLVQAMLDDGAPLVALRMGADGSLVQGRDHAAPLAIPAVTVPDVVDQTGAGNTYCGGFLVGWMQSRDALTAGCYGAVAASFALETTGITSPPDPAERDARLARLRARIAPEHPA